MFAKKSYTKKLAIAAAVSLGLAGTLAGCADNSKQENGSIALQIYSDNPSWADGFQAAGDEIAKITGHTFEAVSLPSTENYQQVVQASLSTKKPGDIVKWANGKALQQLAATGNLTDLTPVWELYVENGWIDDSLRPAYTYEDKVYGVPLAQSYDVIFYNKKLFAENGLEVPETYDDFTKVAQAVKDIGVTPLWAGEAKDWSAFLPYQALIGSVSPEFYVELTENKASFGDAPSVEALTLWQEWLENGWTTTADTTLNDAPGLFQSGKIAMFQIGTWNNGNIIATGMEPGVDYGAFLLPPVAGGKQAAFTSGSALTVPKNAPNHDAAIEQLESWLDPAVQEGWSAFLGDTPVNPKVVPADPIMKELSAQLASGDVTVLTRYYEALPPNLVQESISILAGLMVSPATLEATVESLVATEAKEWEAWNAQ